MRAFICLLLLLSSGVLRGEYVISTPGKLLIEENFDGSELPERFRSGVGDWRIVDHALRGRELAESKHSAFRKIFLDHRNVIYQFDLKIEGEAFSQILINYDLVHLARCVTKLNEFGVYKVAEDKKRAQMAAEDRDQGDDPLDRNWNEKTHALKTDELKLDEGRWYHVTIEMVGDRIAMQVDGNRIEGSHPGITEKKTNFGFQAVGLQGYVYYDNVRVWEAVPANDGHQP